MEMDLSRAVFSILLVAVIAGTRSARSGRVWLRVDDLNP
jgi:hypothetical protein